MSYNLEDYNKLALLAVINKDKEIVIDMLKKGANNYIQLMDEAYELHNYSILLSILEFLSMEQYNTIDMNYILSLVIDYGYNNIVWRLLNEHYVTLNQIAEEAAVLNNAELVKDAIEHGADNYYEIITTAKDNGSMDVLNVLNDMDIYVE